MDTKEEHSVILANTLRKIGRNLLNYQIVERLWKAPLNIADSTMVFGAETGATEEQGGKKRNIPMGWVAENHRKALFTPIPDTEGNEASTNITLRTSFRVCEDGVLNKT